MKDIYPSSVPRLHMDLVLNFELAYRFMVVLKNWKFFVLSLVKVSLVKV